jgi:inner membrane protein
MGIRPFAPLLDAHYTLNLVYASDPTANAAFLVAGVTVHLLNNTALRVWSPSTPPESESVAPFVETDTDLS